MPRRSLAPCLGGPDGGRCPELTRSKRCPRHEKEYEAAHQGDNRWVYSDPRWRALRRVVLAEKPFCEHPGCHSASTDVDHIVPLREGGEPFARSNTQGLCKMHHSMKTADEVWRRK